MNGTVKKIVQAHFRYRSRFFERKCSRFAHLWSDPFNVINFMAYIIKTSGPEAQEQGLSTMSRSVFCNHAGEESFNCPEPLMMKNEEFGLENLCRISREKIQKVLQSENLLLSLHLNYNNIQSQQMSNNVCTDLFTVSCKDVRLSSFFRNL